MRFKKGALLFLMEKSRMSLKQFRLLIGKNERDAVDIINGGLVKDRSVAERIIKRFGALNSIFAIDWEASGIKQPDFESIFNGGKQKYAN